MDLHWKLRRLILGRPVVIVSGLPRSGTSMVMRMLRAGGLDVMTDGVRGNDVDNQHGYYELEKTKSLANGKDGRWLRSCRGRGLKVISHLLRYLPRGLSYQVIFIKRNLEEVLESQERMLHHRGVLEKNANREKLREAFEFHLQEVRLFLECASNFRTLFLSYAEVLESPAGAAEKINTFLGGGLDEAAMASGVDRSLQNRVRRR